MPSSPRSAPTKRSAGHLIARGGPRPLLRSREGLRRPLARAVIQVVRGRVNLKTTICALLSEPVSPWALRDLSAATCMHLVCPWAELSVVIARIVMSSRLRAPGEEIYPSFFLLVADLKVCRLVRQGE